ncbi:hypothetical protein AB4Z48_06135 [Cupriavidus sp. 2TAF22]|uniref:hypothetical protein n=1 Tax=unclassified Cupriavidus TaxID=2640874 RepID=UPI003F8E7956
MTSTAAPYRPISCEFHDRLEDLATVRKPVQIHYRDADGTPQQRTATITDVYGRGGVEYLTLKTGETLRLDQLVKVDGETLADY